MIILALILDKISNLIWGPALLLPLLGSGIFFTVITGLFPIRKIGFIIKSTFGKIFKSKSAFASTATALGATVGTGNIVGVCSAITLGGPGAVFWLWVGAVFGMMLKFAESSLAIKYRGGAAVYIEKAFGNKRIAGFWCICCALASFGGGNMIQSNSAGAVCKNFFGVNPLLIGILLSALTAFILFKGANAVTKTSAYLVPIMAGIYVIGSLGVIFLCRENIPKAFENIFSKAFEPLAVGGGFFGLFTSSALRVGITKGTFTHEAGMGSASLAHSESDEASPAVQGCWGIIEVFVDTIVVCTLTALVILCGQMNSAEDVFLCLSMFLFALAAIIGWAFYGEKALKYITKSNILIKLYKICFCFAVLIGSVASLPAIWSITDIFNGLMIFPNITAILLLWKEVRNFTLKNKKDG